MNDQDLAVQKSNVSSSFMDRRSLIKMTLAGCGLSIMPRAIAQPMPADGKDPSFSILLDRARAALDQHQSANLMRDRVGIADFTLPSFRSRFHIVDLLNGRSISFLVSHGKGSDPQHSGWLQRFSNEHGSLATSAGAYRTGANYHGIHGLAKRLQGLDPLNSNAEDRAIVIHGAPYVGSAHVATWGKIGRSEGCFVFAPLVLPNVVDMLGEGRLLYAGKV